MMERTKDGLRILQALPLDIKVELSKKRIREWYEYFDGMAYVSFSGGKDSSVLLHLVRSIYPDIPAVFCDTGLEYPEIKSHVYTVPNTEIVRPKMMFNDVITVYGYPIVSKEVAEAIYFARSKSGVKSDRSKIELHGDRVIVPKEKVVDTKRQIIRMRLGLLGKRPVEGEKEIIDSIIDEENKKKRLEQGGENSEGNDSAIVAMSYYRKMLMGKYTGYGDINNLKKSQFNKEKWLTLAQNAPFRISAECCHIMKKAPVNAYKARTKRRPYIGMLAEESRMRKQAWIRRGCNAFCGRRQTSNPLSFWTEQDILQYILRYGVEIPSVYGNIVRQDKEGQLAISEVEGTKLVTTGANRTGCVFCGFGMHLEKGETRFQRLQRTHPRLYEYAIGGGKWIDNPDYIQGLSCEPDEYGWIPWNPERIWVPDKHGLGFGFVFDKGNEIYGREMWRYK